MELVNNIALWRQFLKGSGYVLGEIIGRGGFGDVFSASSSSDGAKYAIKRLVSRRSIMNDPTAVREIKALMELNHPRVVQMKEVLLCDRMACIVMELASSGNLEMVAQSSRLPQAFVMRAFRQVTCAIEYCHSCGIAHRDVNPTNVLVFDTGGVKIADFGLCFRCKDESNGNDLLLCSDYLGQEAYLAPEVKIQKPFHPIPADVWSLGCVLLFMISNSIEMKSETDISNLHGSNIHDTERTSHTNSVHAVQDINDRTSQSSRAISNSESMKDILCCAMELKRIKPSERPSASEVLHRWTNISAQFLE